MFGNIKKSLFIGAVVFGLVAVMSVVFVLNFYQTPFTQAGSGDNVFGWAWSENTGWISFNNTSGGGGINYGVNIASDGTLSGYAWSENIGWITFNPAELAGCPSGTCKAWVDLATGQFSGWAKALAGASGWEGWIKLRGANYGVDLNFTTKEFEGWAWGDTVVGWVSFNCKNQLVCSASDYKVKTSFSFPPRATNPVVDQGDYCSYPLHPIFSWTFTDPDPTDFQGAYRIQIDDDSNLDDSPLIDSCSPWPGTCSQGNNSLSYTTLSPLSYDTTYWWRVKVWDNNGVESIWTNGPSFTTVKHAYPRPDFVCTPLSPTQGELVQCCSTKNQPACPSDISVCYDDKGKQISCSGNIFEWTFPLCTEFATGSSAFVENPQVKFNCAGQGQSISLRIVNSVGGCTKTKTLNVYLPLPKWKEIAP